MENQKDLMNSEQFNKEKTRRHLNSLLLAFERSLNSLPQDAELLSIQYVQLKDAFACSQERLSSDEISDLSKRFNDLSRKVLELIFTSR